MDDRSGAVANFPPEQRAIREKCFRPAGTFIEFKHGARTTLMNDRWRRHYLAWARPYSASVMGRVGSVRGRLFHLWHGDIKDRRYGERHSRMQAFEFDPFDDIALGQDGCWRWNSDKKALHTFVRSYFESRNEDGAPE
jgi:hypothetical protein